MKRFIYILLLVSGFNAISAELWTVQELEESIRKTDQNLILLDVRTESEFDDGHIRNAINIPHDEILKSPNLVSSYKNKKMVIFCRTGVRADKVIQALENLGFENIIDIDGDMLAWNKASYSVNTNNE